MSFEAQEQTLFALLFDAALRERFCSEPAAALAGRGLDDAEIEDFLRIPAAALRLDARLRIDMVLSQLCAGFPAAVTAVASGPGGLALLRSLVTVPLLRSDPVDRSRYFGERLRERLAPAADVAGSGPPPGGPLEVAPAVLALLEAELAMARTSAELRHYLLDTGFEPAPDEPVPGDWLERPASIAAHVSAVVIPGPYGALVEKLCPVPARSLWRHLRDREPGPEHGSAGSSGVDPGLSPAISAAITAAIAAARPLLHVARAEVEHMSACAPVVRHRTVELAAGFGALLPGLDGERSIADLLGGLAGAGGDAATIDSARSGFRQLLDSGMVVIC